MNQISHFKGCLGNSQCGVALSVDMLYNKFVTSCNTFVICCAFRQLSQRRISTMTINKKLLASLMVLAASSSVFAASNTVPNCPENTKVNSIKYITNSSDCDTLEDYKAQLQAKLSQSSTKADVLKALTNIKKTNIKVTTPVKTPTGNTGSGSVKNPGTSTPTTPVKTPEVTPAPTTTPTTPVDSSVSAYENQVLQLVNVERQKNGLSALTMDTALSNVARKKSEDMKAKNYFSHTSPTYGSPFDMMKQFGISYKAAGENIAMGQRTPQEVVTAWMNSPGHRANILNANFTHLGVGYVASGNYWTRMFIGK